MNSIITTQSIGLFGSSLISSNIIYGLIILILCLIDKKLILSKEMSSSNQNIMITGSEKGIYGQVGVEKKIISGCNPDLTYVFGGRVSHYHPMQKGCRGHTSGGVRIGFTFRF